MMRFATWEADLAEYLAGVRDRPLEWGAHDCGLFFAGACKVMTGFDPGEPFRGKYSTEMGAAKALKRFGAGSLESTLDGLFEVTPAAFIQRGDGVWNGESVGVAMSGYALFVGETVTTNGEPVRHGLVRVTRAEWTKGWRV